MREAAGIVGGLRRGCRSGAKLPFGHSLNPNLPAGGKGGTGRHQPRIQVPGRAGKVVGCPGLQGTPCDSGSASIPALTKGCPSSRRQQDLNPEPHPELEEPDGGFRKV